MYHSDHIVRAVSAPATPLPSTAAEAPPGVVSVGIGIFAAIELALAVFMALSPHAFFTAIGPFGTFNGHYILSLIHI